MVGVSQFFKMEVDVKNRKCKKLPFNVLMMLHVLIFFVITGCGGTVSKKISSPPCNSEGVCEFIFSGQRGYGTFNSYGSMSVNVSGEITGGSMNNFGVNIEALTGGTLTITPEGAATAIIDVFLYDTNNSGKQIIPDGQMTLNKDIIVYAGDFTFDRKGLGILMKMNGSFTTYDLKGTWVFPLDGIFSVSIDSTGLITQCTFLPVEGDAGSCKGNFLITPQGAVSGEIETINRKTFKTDFNGRMNPNKNSMILAGGISTNFEGMAALAVRKSGTFSPTDGKGMWKIFMTTYKDVLYGTIEVNDSGIITGGEWKTARARTGTFTKGSFLLKDGGEISGFIDTSAGNTYRIIGGQMNAEKDLIGTMYIDSSKLYGVMTLVKKF
jgi:hypothetical protein